MLQEQLYQLQCVIVSIVKTARRLRGENSVEVLYFVGRGFSVSCQVADGCVSGELGRNRGLRVRVRKLRVDSGGKTGINGIGSDICYLGEGIVEFGEASVGGSGEGRGGNRLWW